jgi:transcriptional regulator with XRE-family HTH domain
MRACIRFPASEMALDSWVGAQALAKPSRDLFFYNLDRIMTAKGVNNAELARRLKVNRSVVTNWRNEVYAPKEIETLGAIAAALDVPTSELFLDPTDSRSIGGDAVARAQLIVGEIVKQSEDTIKSLTKDGKPITESSL